MLLLLLLLPLLLMALFFCVVILLMRELKLSSFELLFELGGDDEASLTGLVRKLVSFLARLLFWLKSRGSEAASKSS